MSAPDLSTASPAELELGMHAALRAHDVQAAYGFLMLIALKDPERADALRTVLQVAIEVSRSEQGGAE